MVFRGMELANIIAEILNSWREAKLRQGAWVGQPCWPEPQLTRKFNLRSHTKVGEFFLFESPYQWLKIQTPELMLNQETVT